MALPSRTDYSAAAAPLPSRGRAGVGSVTSSAEGLHAVSFAAFSPRPGLRPPRPLEGWGVAARCLLHGDHSAAATTGGLPHREHRPQGTPHPCRGHRPQGTPLPCGGHRPQGTPLPYRLLGGSSSLPLQGRSRGGVCDFFCRRATRCIPCGILNHDTWSVSLYSEGGAPKTRLKARVKLAFSSNPNRSPTSAMVSSGWSSMS